MEEIRKRQFKEALSALTGDGLLSLDEAAKLLRVSEIYLMGLIRRGKVKAFKVDDQWLVHLHWVEDFKDEVRRHIDEELAIRPATSSRWVKRVDSRRHPATVALVFSVQTFAIALFVAIIMPTLIFVFPQLGILKTGGETLGQTVLKVSYVSQVSIDIAKSAASSSQKINDERLTKFIGSILNKSAGQVAGAREGFSR